jgi:hypothetical protein
VGRRRFADLLTVGGKLYHETHFAPLLRMHGAVGGIALELVTSGGVIFGGKLSRFDEATGQVQNITPIPLKGPDVRVDRTEPILFSPQDPHRLYFAANRLYVTVDGGSSWNAISPDLAREDPGAPGPARDTFPEPRSGSQVGGGRSARAHGGGRGAPAPPPGGRGT